MHFGESGGWFAILRETRHTSQDVVVVDVTSPQSTHIHTTLTHAHILSLAAVAAELYELVCSCGWEMWWVVGWVVRDCVVYGICPAKG